MKNNNHIKKVVLAYSGGLDTSIIISWLKENYNCEVIAVVGNVGQKDELIGLEEKAIKTGASKCYIEDLTEEFVNDYIFPTIKAGAIYEGKYLLGTAFARPIIAKRLVEIAIKEGADAIVHGCTGKGNDQVRFELAVKAFAPDMKIIAPWRIWDIKSREEEIEYALERKIPISISYETNYSKDKNLWHLSHEGLDLEDPANEPNYGKILELSNTLENAPDKPTYIKLKFEKGIPVKLNGEKLDGVTLIEKLNKIGGENAIGIIDMVENRLVGMKSRGVYETPGGAILYKAHKDLEEILSEDENLSKTGNLHGTSMLILSIIGATTDIGDAIITIKHFGVPSKYKDVFLILGERKLISEDLKNSMLKLIGYRNILAHEYGYIEKETIFEILEELNTTKEIIDLARDILLEK